MLSNLKRKAESAAASEKTSMKRSKAEERALESRDRKHKGQNQNDVQKQFPKTKVEKIFLVCPPSVQTGGPEAMHQLCNEINATSRENGEVSALMLYIEEKRDRAYLSKTTVPLDTYSSIYPNIQVCTNWPDADGSFQNTESEDSKDSDDSSTYSSSLVIWPEIWTNLVDSLEGNHQNAIWWLSVNNNSGKYQQWGRRDILHLYQSQYAKCHILKNIEKARANNINNGGGEPDDSNILSKQVLPMTEYIYKSLVEVDQSLEDSQRDLEILYNPLKGIHYTDAIRKRSDKKFQFTPIGGSGDKRITPAQVTKLLHRAKVYIDFGPHPGMDRLPREAALANCIVITNTAGAAFYDEDVPIPSSYKIDTFDVEKIHSLLKKAVEEYDVKKADFDTYRKWIVGQKIEMEGCVKRLVDTVVTERSQEMNKNEII